MLHNTNALPRPPPNRVDPEVFDQLIRKMKRARSQLMGGKPHLREFP